MIKKIIIATSVILVTFAIIFSNGTWRTAISKKVASLGVVTYTRTHSIDPATTKESAAPTVTFTFGGDIMLDRGVRRSVEKNFAGDYSALFKNAEPLFSSDDITFLNLEGPVSDKGHNVGSIYSFEMNPVVLPVIKKVGIDIVSFANNHVGDYTKGAFIDTMDRLTANDIAFTGAGKNYADATSPKIIEKNGIKVGFLGFTDVGPAWLGASSKTPDSAGILLASDPNYAEIISSAKTKVDVLVVSFHWGIEYKPHTERQTSLAHLAIDSGADIIVGGHPHVPQDLETYKNKLIIYSLGNFIFDQYFSKETMQGLVVRTTVTKDVSNNTFSISNTTQYVNQLNKFYAIESITPIPPKNLPPKTSSIPLELHIGWVGDIPPSNTVPTFSPTVLSWLEVPDIMTGNLEGALAQIVDEKNPSHTSANTAPTNIKCSVYATNCYSFVGNSTFAKSLKTAGFDLLNLANNHSEDQGKDGIQTTKNILTAHSLLYSPENGELTHATVKGVDVGFLSFGHNAWTTKIFDLEKVKSAVQDAASKYSVVIVFFHGGAEGADKTHVPRTTEYYLGENRGDVYTFAHTAIDAGADLVLGSGPHVVRGIEKYNDKLIVYSAGNFLATDGLSNTGNLGSGALFNITIDQNGNYKNLAILSTTSAVKNTISEDPSNTAEHLITSLSKEDFGQNF